MKLIDRFIDIFWPLLEKEGNTNQASTNVDFSKIDSNNLSELFDRIIACYNEEEKRRKNVESKSNSIIGASCISLFLITAICVNMMRCKEIDVLTMIIAVLLIVLIAYLGRSVWFSIKVFERKPYSILLAEEYISAYSKPNIYEDLITNLSEAIRFNAKINNSKVDNMTMAQEYFKRAIVSLCSFGILFALECLIMKIF
ncbi:MAG: hypothetical protein LBL13_03350 [Bacteroidales bacterium]|jgi:hypothetical protein|nr:hypothetical protein [Bacteroidales bacterium]